MSIKLLFSNDKYKERALSKKKVNYENDITSYDAFFICIHDLEFDVLNNLCNELHKYYPETGLNQLYEQLQDFYSSNEFKRVVLECAIKLVSKGEYLGTKIINEKYNASAWLCHSINEGLACATLAEGIANPDTAMKLGLLHDIGRKKDHSFNHVILGYELLNDYDLESEAVACLTHSFIPDVRKFYFKGSRCANCEKSIDGLTIYGNMEDSINIEDKDDICLFLDNYEYNIYDLLLNISDLMAMTTGITSPYDRVNDIYTRKSPDEKNQDLFLFRLICLMNYIMFARTKKAEYIERLNLEYTNHEDLYKKFIVTSNELFEFYNNLNSKKKYLS